MNQQVSAGFTTPDTGWKPVSRLGSLDFHVAGIAERRIYHSLTILFVVPHHSLTMSAYIGANAQRRVSNENSIYHQSQIDSPGQPHSQPPHLFDPKHARASWGKSFETGRQPLRAASEPKWRSRMGFTAECRILRHLSCLLRRVRKTKRIELPREGTRFWLNCPMALGGA